MHGMGEAMAWANRLLADLERWRAGEIPFEAIERHVVLASEPGLGKTTFARSLAKSARLPLVATSVGAWFSSSAGYLDSVVKAIDGAFARAAASAPAILFLDELDALPSREALGPREGSWWTPVIGHMLTTLDGAISGVAGRLIIVGATNYAQKLDPALIRPGRPRASSRSPNPPYLRSARRGGGTPLRARRTRCLLFAPAWRDRAPPRMMRSPSRT
jgi:hypothetical protein